MISLPWYAEQETFCLLYDDTVKMRCVVSHIVTAGIRILVSGALCSSHKHNNVERLQTAGRDAKRKVKSRSRSRDGATHESKIQSRREE
jgi:hypothetical protein